MLKLSLIRMGSLSGKVLEEKSDWLSINTIRSAKAYTNFLKSWKDFMVDLARIYIYYNNHETHQGKMCCGRTPLETWIDGKQIWKEKFLAKRNLTLTRWKTRHCPIKSELLQITRSIDFNKTRSKKCQP